MDIELVKTLLTVTGPMGILAWVFFNANRQDSKAHADRLVEILKERKDERDQMIGVVQANTAAVTALTTKINHDLAQ